MPKSFILSAALILISQMGEISAQSNPNQKPVLPPGPLVSKTPSTGTWSVTYTYRPEILGQTALMNAIATYPRTQVMESSGGLAHFMTTQVGGGVENMWKYGGSVFDQPDEKSIWITVGPNTGGNYLSDSEFPGVDWITADKFVGIVKYQRADCLLFILGDSGGLDVNDETAVSDKIEHSLNIAVIDLKTRLPIEVHYAGTKEVFHFGAGPGKLFPPKSLTDQIARSTGKPL